MELVILNSPILNSSPGVMWIAGPSPSVAASRVRKLSIRAPLYVSFGFLHIGQQLFALHALVGLPDQIARTRNGNKKRPQRKVGGGVKALVNLHANEEGNQYHDRQAPAHADEVGEEHAT